VIGTDWIVTLSKRTLSVQVEADRQGATVTIDSSIFRVEGDWTPGQSLAKMSVNGEPLVMKVALISSGFRVRYRGADIIVRVRTKRKAELAALMLEKLPPDTSKLLLCPMPGLIVKIDVKVGEEVQEGQILCTIEAMKMENSLRAEKKSIVTKINAKAGFNLAVDDVIMEFE
jgi:propionyl-CoA carboxylase alpha chain